MATWDNMNRQENNFLCSINVLFIQARNKEEYSSYLALALIINIQTSTTFTIYRYISEMSCKESIQISSTKIHNLS